MDDSTVLPLLSFSDLELAGRIGIAVAMATFLGLAFEDIYKHDTHDVPGGIRTFPLLTLGGTTLYLADSIHGLPFVAGVLGVAIWLQAYMRAKLTTGAKVSLMIPAANLVAFALGPLALREPPWVAVAVTVTAVLLLGQREHLHRLVKAVPQEELTTAGKFLILAGVIFPLAPHEAIVPWIPITPYKMWLAVLAVSTLSYLSYLLQRYVSFRGNTLLPAVLGGSYSSTMTTVVLARRQKNMAAPNREIAAGIIAASTTMYLRVAIVICLFNATLAVILLPYLLASMAIGTLLAAHEWRQVSSQPVLKETLARTANPLGLGSAAIFVVLLVSIAVLAAWFGHSFGKGGILALAVIAGAADIDPFLLNLVQGGAPNLSPSVVSAAILLAITSNNVLKAIYAMTLGGERCLRPAIGLLIFALSSGIGMGLVLSHP